MASIVFFQEKVTEFTVLVLIFANAVFPNEKSRFMMKKKFQGKSELKIENYWILKGITEMNSGQVCKGYWC